MRIRVLAWIVLAALAITALVAVVTLAFGTFDDLTGRILATTASIGGYSLLAMGAAAAMTAKSMPLQHQVAAVALVGAAIGLITLLALIWVDDIRENLIFRTCLVSTVTAVALAIVALLQRLALPPSRRWVIHATALLLLALAALIDVPLVLLRSRSEDLLRVIGVVSVLAALGLLCAPVVAWQSARGRRTPTLAGGDPSGAVRLACPTCGTERHAPAGRSVCERCGQGVEITLFRA